MALDITDERVAAAAARLHDGGWSYSSRQLYYAVCADVETAPVHIAPGEVGLGVLFILVGAITGQRILLEILGAIGLVLVVVGAITRVQERRPLPLVRLLATSYSDFVGRFVAGEAVYAGLLAGHAFEDVQPPDREGGSGAGAGVGASDSGPIAPEPGADPAAATGVTLVVCDRAETAAILSANSGRLNGVAVTLLASLNPDLGGRRLIALHDCDPAGCALVAELADRGASPIDVGINPRELRGRRLQILEGAPARLPRDLSGHLDTAETDWLRSGMRLECAVESPDQLVQRIRAAMLGEQVPPGQ